MTVYYNEIDPSQADLLRNLIFAGVIAAGDVDTRDIRDVRPDDLRGYSQCHFFAGIGVWSYALRRAGWPDDMEVWTGSCPCQPFSAAGAGAGFSDERHLWPHWYHLIQECEPPALLGEQVASKDADSWVRLVQADMEGMAYGFEGVPFPAAGVGAPHIRDRLYWVAYADNPRLEGWDKLIGGRSTQRAVGTRRVAGSVGLDGKWWGAGNRSAASKVGRFFGIEGGGLADSDSDPCDEGCSLDGGRNYRGDAQQGGGLGGRGLSGVWRTGKNDGFWSDADWLLCRDNKWRPVEPGSFPLAYGLARGMGSMPSGIRRLAEMAGLDGDSLSRAKSYRIGGLRGYGNALNAEAATTFIECWIEDQIERYRNEQG